MKKRLTQKQLSLLLSSLDSFSARRAFLEQYITPSAIAADMLWRAFMAGDIRGKTVADLGCGSGILGLGAAVLGAKQVYCVDVDANILRVARRNRRQLEIGVRCSLPCRFLCGEAESFSKNVHTIVQNPPFGVQREHADRAFLSAAFACGEVVYSLHKGGSGKFLTSFASDHGWKASRLCSYEFLLARTFPFHTKERYFVEVDLWKFV